MRRIYLYQVFVLFVLFAACEDPDDSRLKDGSMMSLTVLPDSITNVGSGDYITVRVQVPLDGAGEVCTFSTTAGDFEAVSSSKLTTTSVVDVDGYATVTWFPPQIPGTQKISATIKTLIKSREIVVDPVGTITFSDLPASIAPNAVQLFTVSVGKEWAGSAMEIKTTGGNLEATSPVADELENGTKIKPLLDQNGQTQVVYTAPSTAGTFRVTASLYGTFSTRVITVQ
jgi:hypothetical protein